jgi:hypothetical protein
MSLHRANPTSFLSYGLLPESAPYYAGSIPYDRYTTSGKESSSDAQLLLSPAVSYEQSLRVKLPVALWDHSMIQFRPRAKKPPDYTEFIVFSHRLT